ncbi:MAG: SRPBCC domain-containing protein [Bacteroidota bacterium]
MEISTSIQIQASPVKVWEVFSEFSRYSEWNPFLKSIEGNPRPGKRIKINAGGMVIRPVVLAWIPNRKLEWVGKLLVKGLFDGQHSFEFAKNADGTTTFDHREKFSGILVPLFRKKLSGEVREGFENMNRALKERVER